MFVKRFESDATLQFEPSPAAFITEFELDNFELGGYLCFCFIICFEFWENYYRERMMYIYEI